jgi:hypothetical protein
MPNASARRESMADDHERLLEVWKSLPHRSDRFVKDGIIDKNAWTSAKCKVLFVLKEPYDLQDRPEEFDYPLSVRNEIETGKEWPKKAKITWRTLCSWAFLVQNGTSKCMPEFSEWWKDKEALSLGKGAIINVKKQAGRTWSSRSEIRRYAGEDQDFLRRQIELINPKIVVCGNTWHALRDYVWQEGEKKPVCEGVFHIRDWYFIDYSHPGKRATYVNKYSELAHLLQKALAVLAADG